LTCCNLAPRLIDGLENGLIQKFKIITEQRMSEKWFWHHWQMVSTSTIIIFLKLDVQVFLFNIYHNL